ncbi:tripartite motif-containing protein 16-like [Engraulis encrasicolus]|uniref:tripartite motif-containing protein 16-like n=1 Tax=Engraulis encrasicolus TaxID=184585 RepID=UPI002FD598F6
MAEVISTKQDLFMCSICLDLLKDPVTLSCGHNYCSGCINGCWDQEDQKGVYSCPQCRQTFTARPVLNKNNVIAELVEEMRKTRPTIKSDALAVHGDVECDICSGRKLKAVKSCLDCVLSYCETHFKTHNELHPRRSHTVIDATGQLQERICSRHYKALDIFCRTDQSCICYFCLTEEHKGHDTVSAATEWSNKKEGLGEILMRYQETIQKREKEVQELRRAVETLKSSAQSAVEHSDQMFDDIIRSVERRRSEVTELIRAQEKAEVSRAEGLLERLEQEISELKKRVAEMEQLSHTQDPIHFLKNVGSISDIPKSVIPTNMTLSHPYLSFEPVKTSVSALKTKLEEKLDSIFKQEAAKISAAVSEVQAVITEPVTREDFLQYYGQFTLDPNTANRRLHLSEGNRRVTNRDEAPQSYPDHPERFDNRRQVLCREGVSGRCYWEVEWSGEWANIAVSYKTISRKGLKDDSCFGNNKSWKLTVQRRKTNFTHNKIITDLPLVASSRVGVYVDHRAGTLAFYSISDTMMTLLHKVQTTFSHTLYPGFRLPDESSVKLL